jgi:hypothetical protein
VKPGRFRRGAFLFDSCSPHQSAVAVFGHFVDSDPGGCGAWRLHSPTPSGLLGNGNQYLQLPHDSPASAMGASD